MVLYNIIYSCKNLRHLVKWSILKLFFYFFEIKFIYFVFRESFMIFELLTAVFYNLKGNSSINRIAHPQDKSTERKINIVVFTFWKLTIISVCLFFKKSLWMLTKNIFLSFIFILNFSCPRSVYYYYFFLIFTVKSGKY